MITIQVIILIILTHWIADFYMQTDEMAKELNDIGNITGENGIKVALNAQKLIVPIASRFEADRIMNSVQRVGTAENDINALKAGSYLPQGHMVNHYLSSSSRWFVKTNVPNSLFCNVLKDAAPIQSVDKVD